MASSIAPLQLFSQDSQNKIQHVFFGHVMHLVLPLAACDAEGIVYGTVTFITSDNQNDVQHDF